MATSKALRLAISLLVAALLFGFGWSSIRAQTDSKESHDDPLSSITTINASRVPIEDLLSILANSHSPIAFPGSLRKGEPRRTISIVRENISLRGILDEMARQAPEYQWSEANGLITVSAHDQMSGILDVELNDVAYEGILFCGLEQRIVTRPEVVQAIRKHGIEPTYRDMWDPSSGLCTCFVSGPYEPEIVSLEFKSITLRDLLNTIIRRDYAKSWAFEFGEDGKTVALKFYRLRMCHG